MNEDPRDDTTLLGLAAVAVLAALCVVLAYPAGSQERVPDAFGGAATVDEAQWIQTEQPGEEMLSRRTLQRDALQRRRQADEDELAALVRHSEQAVERSRRAAAELEASVRALRPAVEAAAEAQRQAGQ